MILPHMRIVIAFVLLCLPASLLALSDDGRKHTVSPNQQHAAAQASLAIHLKVAPVVLPPRHKDRDHDKDQDGSGAAVLYNLFPAEEKFSTSRETRTMAVEGGKQELVQLTTLVMK
jgi:hypothetical protein